MDDRIVVTEYISPVGRMAIGALGGRVCVCDWADSPHHAAVQARVCRIAGARPVRGTTDVAEQTMRELDGYFAGERRVFDVPVLMCGTPFQRRVWHTLTEIPYGHTITYGEQARRAGYPAAVRAVASACGANALSVLVPCHRVVGSGGRLTGYAGGLEAKRALLLLEGANTQK